MTPPSSKRAILLASAGDPPWAANRWVDLEREAQAAFVRRHESYPDFVEQGKLDPDWARIDMAAWDAIRDDWRWINSDTGEHGQRATRDTVEIRLDAIDTAIDRWAEKYGERHIDDDATEHGHRLIALRWHVARERDYYAGKIRLLDTIHGLTDFNHEARRRWPKPDVLPLPKGERDSGRLQRPQGQGPSTARHVPTPPAKPVRDLFAPHHDRKAA